MMGDSYRAVTVPVRGGDLAVGVWGPESGPTIIAIHGITASHASWALVAQALPEFRIIAPDLRGRGRSNGLPGPWGMRSHADDMAAVLDAFGIDACAVVGHSMGAFVCVSLARFHPRRVASLLLVDGGLPIPLPEGVALEDLPQNLIGPAAERLSMTFESAEAYRDFWRQHPAFVDDWTQAVQDYIDYDLEGVAPELTPSGVIDAVAQDSLELAGDVDYAAALTSLRIPVVFVRAPRGLLGQVPALYEATFVDEWREHMPTLEVIETRDVNHYTVILAQAGVAQLAPAVRAALERHRHADEALR